jgi:VWFA-related protein
MRIFLVALLALAVAAQERPPDVTLKTGASEVLLDLIVRDKKGRAVKDLRADEIELLDDGIPATVKTLRFGSISDQAQPGVEGAALDPTREVRLITFLFERMNRESAIPARRAAQELVARASGSNVYFAVLLVRERLRVLQPYTTNKAELKKALELAAGDTKGRTEAMSQQAEETLRSMVQSTQQMESVRAGNLSSLGPQSAPGAGNADPSAMAAFADVQRAGLMLNMLRASEQMARERSARPSFLSLRAAVESQRTLPGRKTLVYFSEGLQVPAPLEFQFRAVIGAANRAGVSIYCIDATGLEISERTRASVEMLRAAAQSSMETVTAGGDAPVKREQVMSLDTAEQSMRSNNFSALAELASSTGGLLLADTNDLSKSAQRVAEDVSSYYQLSYVPPATEYDGRFRAVTIRIKRPNVRAQTRSGYFALPPEAGPGLSAFEIPLLRFLEAPEQTNAFPFWTGFVRLGGDGTQVSGVFMADVPLQKIRFEQDPTAKTLKARLALLTVFRGRDRQVVAKLSRELALQFPAEQAQAAAQETFPWREPFEVPAGTYTVETAVWDRTGDQVSVRRDEFVAHPGGDLDLSDVALVKAFEPAREGVEDLLRYGSSHIVPGVVERLQVAGRDGSLALFFRVRGVPGAGPVSLAIEAQRDGVVLAENALPYSETEMEFPYVASLPTAALTAGRYEITIVVKQGERRVSRKVGVDIDWAPGAAPSSEPVADLHLQLARFDAVAGAATPGETAQASMIAILSQRAGEYVKLLPNFFCIQTTRRLIDASGSGSWKESDTWEEILSYVEGRENYDAVKSRADDTEKARTQGVSSRGELGGLFEAVLGAAAKASIRWKAWADLNGERVHVFDYRVERENSKYALTWSGRWQGRSYWRTDPAYEGQIFVDPETLHIRRITLQTGEVPANFPIQQSTHAIDYDWQRIGEADYLMPVHAVVETRVGQRRLVRNEIRFHDYRKWAATSAVSFEK